MAPRRVVWGIWLGLVLAGTGCSSKDSGTSPPAQVTVVSVTVAPATLSLVAGVTGSLSAAATGSNGAAVSSAAVSWTSETPAVATVAGSGASATVSAVAPGTATIRASVGNVSGSAQVTVTPAPVARVAITLAERSILRGDSATATAATYDANDAELAGRAIQWSSSEPTVMLPSSSGKVYARSRGSAYLRATSEGRVDSVAVTVRSVRQVTVTPDSALVLPRSTLTLSASVVADSGVDTSVIWRSLVPGRATVNASGEVTVLLQGGDAPIEAIAAFDTTVRDTARVKVIDTCVPLPITIGATVGGRYEASDCDGVSDYYEYQPKVHTVARFTLSGVDQNVFFPVDTLWNTSGSSANRVRYAAVPPGSYRVRVTRADATTLGQQYKLVTEELAQLPDCTVAQTTLGAQFDAVLTPACDVYSYTGVGDRPGIFFQLRSVPGKQVKITARSTAFPVYVEVVGSSSSNTFANTLVAGGTVVMAVPIETTSKALLLYVTSVHSGANGTISIKIDP